MNYSFFLLKNYTNIIFKRIYLHLKQQKRYFKKSPDSTTEMKSCFTFLLIAAFLFVSCEKKIQKTKTDSSKTTESHSAVLGDSIEEAFLAEKIFYTTVIRLYPNQSAFLFIDDDYIEQNVSDTIVKKLYQNAEYLAPENREAFYQKIVGSLPKEDLRILDRIWNLKEVREQVAGDGGLHTLVTWITQKPDKNDPFYYIEVRRLYRERLGTCTGIGFIKIEPKTNALFVMNTEGVYLPLAEWRKTKQL